METLLISAVLPALLDMFKSAGPAISRKIVGVSVDDQIKLEQSTVSKLEALAKLENPGGTPSQWVIDLRASFRYVAAGVLIIGGLAIAVTGYVQNNATLAAVGLEAAGQPFAFVFGERMWQGLTGRAK